MTPPVDVGLCRSCLNVQLVTSARHSTFYLCRLSTTDPRFPKYPSLPVRQCAGYVFDETTRDREAVRERTRDE